MAKKYKPEKGKICVVSAIPQCNFCAAPGPYDFKTKSGPWANACESHYKIHREHAKLGTGMGQLWITKDQVEISVRDHVVCAFPDGEARVGFVVSLIDKKMTIAFGIAEDDTFDFELGADDLWYEVNNNTVGIKITKR